MVLPSFFEKRGYKFVCLLCKTEFTHLYTATKHRTYKCIPKKDVNVKMSDKKKRICHNTRCMWNDGIRRCEIVGDSYETCEAKRVIAGNIKGTRYTHDSNKLKRKASE